jgi:DNA polymerase III delta subunit
MHSKFLPWDFIDKYPQTISRNSNGIFAILSPDPYIEGILTKNLPKQEKEFQCYTGSDISREFIEEHFCNLSFFSQNENLYIINGEMISVQNSSLFLEKMNEIAVQSTIVLFFSKSSKLFLELTKHSTVQAFTIESPRFWEGQKMLQLGTKEKKLDLKPDVIKFILDNIEHNFESIFRALDIIKISFSDANINLAQLKALITRERFDIFELVDLYYQNPKKLYEVMLSNELDFDWLRSVASFMQGHLVKILFPMELMAKGKLSKYDQAIVFQREKLNKEAVKNDLTFFADLEIFAKARDQLILNHLRLKIIK